LSLIQYARSKLPGLQELDLVGVNGAGPWAAAARAQAGSAIRCLAVDTGGFRFADVRDIQDVNFLPGGAKYGDLPGVLALGAPGKLWLAGEGAQIPSLLRQMYEVAGAQNNATHSKAAPAQRADEAVKWLLSE
jgi:hypothetical protein